MTIKTERNILSVSMLNKYIKQLFSLDELLSSIWVRGEISNFKNHSSGHMYFTLKDEGAVVKAIMFKGYNSYLKFKPQDGMRVIIKGQISVYEKDGVYQLYAEYMEPDGVGSLHVAFEQLKQELGQMGYFEASRKRKIPYLPRQICVVTSPTGAVIRDIIHVLGRRFPSFRLRLYPVAVQGESAAPQIAAAIDNINKFGLSDVIIVARGGGSLEELWAFNEKIVAQSIFRSEIPVISAVGHETDYTICDFVADLRAPTPSAAAELVLPEKLALYNGLLNMKSRLNNALLQFTRVKRNLLEQLLKRPALTKPMNMLNNPRQRLDSLCRNLSVNTSRVIYAKKTEFIRLAASLEALSPLGVMTRGFSIVRDHKKNIIKSIQDVQLNDKIRVELIDGKLDCVVNTVNLKGG